jgi:hypothetical protein
VPLAHWLLSRQYYREAAQPCFAGSSSRRPTVQRREIARLRRYNLRLKEEVGREAGQPIQFAAEEWRLLVEKADGIGAETLKQISVLGVEKLTPAKSQTDSAEH